MCLYALVAHRYVHVLTHAVPPRRSSDRALGAAGQWRRKPEGRFAMIAPSLETDAAFAHRVLRDALRESGGETLPDAAGDCGPELAMDPARAAFLPVLPYNVEIGRASCRERVCQYV